MKPVYLLVLMGHSVLENQCLCRPPISPNSQKTRCFSISYSSCVTTFCINYIYIYIYIYIYPHSKSYIHYTNAIRLQFKQLDITLTMTFTSAAREPAREPARDNYSGSST